MIFMEIAAIVAILIFVLLIGVATEAYDHWPVTTLLFLGLVASCFIWGMQTVFVGVIWANIHWILVSSPIYLAVGVLWSIFMWDRLCKEAYHQYVNAKEVYVKAKLTQQNKQVNNQGFQTPMDRIELEANLPREPDKASYKPQWQKKKGKITGWILYWPFSMFAFIVGEYIFEMMGKLISMCGTWYETRTNKRFE